MVTSMFKLALKNKNHAKAPEEEAAMQAAKKAEAERIVRKFWKFAVSMFVESSYPKGRGCTASGKVLEICNFNVCGVLVSKSKQRRWKRLPKRRRPDMVTSMFKLALKNKNHAKALEEEAAMQAAKKAEVGT